MMEEFILKFKKINRIQMEKETYIVTIQTHDLVFSNDRFKDYECYKNGFNLCLARGDKFVSTKNRPITIDQDSKLRVIEFNEPLSLVVTIYKNPKTGEYQEKYGKLVLRTFNEEEKKYDGLCAHKLKLHSLISNAMTSGENDAMSVSSKDHIWSINGDGELALDCQFTCQRINIDDNEMMKMVETITNNSCKSYRCTAVPEDLKRNNKIASAYNTPECTPNTSPVSSRERVDFSPTRSDISSSASCDDLAGKSSKSSRAERLTQRYGKELKYPTVSSSKDLVAAAIVVV